MKIVLVRQRIGESFGGAEGYAALLAAALRDEGADVRLLAQDVDAAAQAGGHPWVRAARWPTNVLGVMSFVRYVEQYIRDHPDHLIFSFDRMPGVDFIRAGDGSHAAYLESMGQSPAFSVKHQMYLTLERQAYTHPLLRGIIANSRMVADDLQSRYGISAGKIRVIHTGLPSRPAGSWTKEEARAQLNLPPDARIILFAGHNYARKGLGTLLDAIARTDGGWTVLVAGKGDVPAFESKARAAGILDRVRFYGPRDLGELFAAADLFVLPTRYDPFARVCLEAARAGLPVVTTRRNGFSEFIGPTEGGVMEDPTRAEDLAGILSRLSPADLAGMGRRLRDRTAHLTIPQNARDLLNYFRETLADRRAAARHRVLVVKPSSLGDIVHSLPVVSALARGGMDVHFAARREYRDLLDMCPSIRRILDFPKRWSEVAAFVHDLRSSEYDTVIDLQGLLRSALASSCAHTRRRIGLPDSREAALFFYDEVASYEEGVQHAIERYLSVLSEIPDLEPARGSAEDYGLRIQPEADDAAARLTEGASGYVVFSPLARQARKLWDPKRWVDLAQMLRQKNIRVVVVGRGASPWPDGAAEWINLINRTSLPELCAVIRRARMCVAVDSAPMHLAAALAVPVVALFGPTDPAKVGPFCRRRTILRSEPPGLSDLTCPGVAAVILSELDRNR